GLRRRRLPLREPRARSRVAPARSLQRSGPARPRRLYCLDPGTGPKGVDEAARGAPGAARLHGQGARRAEPVEHGALGRMGAAEAGARRRGVLRPRHKRALPSRHEAFALAAGQGATPVHVRSTAARSTAFEAHEGHPRIASILTGAFVLDESRTRVLIGLASSPTPCANLCDMASRNPERDRRFGTDADPLAKYLHDYSLVASCQGPGCIHSRKLSVAQMLRWLGTEATVGDMRRRLRCSRCGQRAPAITAVWTGKRGGER